jgi:hypothetical protein
MSVHFIFRCQFCDAQPDPMTQLSLQQAMRENTWGAYQDALPGRWLVFHGRGLYGPPRYACTEHRGDLVAYLRAHYGTKRSLDGPLGRCGNIIRRAAVDARWRVRRGQRGRRSTSESAPFRRMQ